MVVILDKKLREEIEAKVRKEMEPIIKKRIEEAIKLLRDEPKEVAYIGWVENGENLEPELDLSNVEAIEPDDYVDLTDEDVEDILLEEAREDYYDRK